MTRHKDQHEAILTRRRGDTEAHPPHRTEPEIAGSFRFIRTQGHNNKHARHGIRLCHGTESVVLCTHSPVNDEEPFLGAFSITSLGELKIYVLRNHSKHSPTLLLYRRHNDVPSSRRGGFQYTPQQQRDKP